MAGEEGREEGGEGDRCKDGKEIRYQTLAGEEEGNRGRKKTKKEQGAYRVKATILFARARTTGRFVENFDLAKRGGTESTKRHGLGK